MDNPLCDLLRIARQSTISPRQNGPEVTKLLGFARESCPTDPRACELIEAFKTYGGLIEDLPTVGLKSALSIDPEWRRTDLRAVNMEEEFTFSDQPSGPRQLRDLLLAESAFETSMVRASAWLRASRIYTHHADTLGALAGAEFWQGSPVDATRAYLDGLNCAIDASPLILDTCRLQRDVAHLALVEVYGRLHARHEQVRKSRFHLDHPEARPTLHRLDLIEQVAQTRLRLFEGMRQGGTVEQARDSRDGALLLDQITTLLSIEYEATARDVYRAVAEAHAFEMLSQDIDKYRGHDEKLAGSQLAFWQSSFELKELTDLMTERMDQAFGKVHDYIENQPGLLRMRAL